MQLVRAKISDSRLLALIQSFLDQSILEELSEWTPESGVPQGAVLSPVLSNLYFRHCNWNIFEAYDGMIRRRLRRQLLKRHRRNPKRLSRTSRWPNVYFTDAGLRSLRDAHTRYVQSLSLGDH